MNLDYYQATDRYRAWINEAVDQERCLGKCEEVCAAMRADFPELEQRKGFYHDPEWKRRGHHWLRFKVPGEDDYQVVDPTVGQFPSGWYTRRSTGERKPRLFPVDRELARYEDLTDLTDEEAADVVPTGVCMECGGPTFRGETFCSSACESAHAAWFNAGCP